MDEDGAAPRLNRNQLQSIEKSLFELARKQKSQTVPVDLPVPAFWGSVGQLLHHLEVELAETIRDEGMTAKAQLKSRRLGTIRTCVSDLTRLRLNAFTQHAILSNLLKSPQGDAVNVAANFETMDWERYDPSERAYYSGVGHLVEKYKHEVSWNALLRGSSIEIPESANITGHAPLTEFVEQDEKVSYATTDAVQTPPSGNWEDPEIDEEDRIRQIDAFPDRATGAAPPAPLEEPPAEDESGLRRILILKDLSDPIITEDGSEIVLTVGDVESCAAPIADTLIAAGFAEPAPL